MDKQQEMLFDYTKFHIGIYISIGTALVGALAFDQINHNHILGDVSRGGFKCALVLQALAGLGGGLICTNLIRSTIV